MLRDPGGPSASFTVGAHFPEEAEAVHSSFHPSAPPPRVLGLTRRRARQCLTPARLHYSARWKVLEKS